MPNWLPNWQDTINNALATYLKEPLEQKSSEWKTLFESKINQFATDNKRFQQVVIALLLTGLVMVGMHLYWKE